MSDHDALRIRFPLTHNLAHRIASVLLAAICALPALGAETLAGGTIAGVVHDSTGAAIPGVTVTATRSGDTSPPTMAVSGSGGDFKLDRLAPGAYTLDAALDGFQSVSKQMKLVPGQKLDVRL